MILLEDLQKKVENRITDYIEFDIKELFDISDYITIYGGAVRDSIAGMEINDVDILCMPESAVKLKNFLIEKDYSPIDLYRQDTISMYKDISLINEPWTLIKNKKIIQIIRPKWFKPNPKVKDYQDAYYNLVKNVDISCCGVFLDKFDNNIKLGEACKDAIIHCITKTFVINDWSALFNQNRTNSREYKLTSRGWKNITSEPDFWEKSERKKIDRRLKICKLEFNPIGDYKIWTEEEYLKRFNNKNKNKYNILDIF